MFFNATHHHLRFYVCFSTLAQVRRFPINSSPPGHPVLCIFFSQLKLSHIPTTHSCHVFLPLPLPFSPSTTTSLHAATQSSLFLRSICPNHLNLPRRTTSNTHSIPNRPNNSSFVFSIL